MKNDPSIKKTSMKIFEEKTEQKEKVLPKARDVSLSG